MLAGRSSAPEEDNDHHLRVDDLLGVGHLSLSGGKSKRSLACLPSASLGGLGWQGDCVRDTSPTSSVYNCTSLSLSVHLSQPYTRLCLNCVQQIPSALVQAIVRQCLAGLLNGNASL